MPKTVVGLFENAELVDAAVHEIEALGFPRREVRTMREPESFDVTGVMSFPRIDFEVDLSRELARIGATMPETEAYVEGLRRGGALAFATGSDERVYAAGNVMNRHGAVDVEEITGAEPVLAGVGHQSITMPKRESSVLAGRIRQPGGGACFFVW
jgi:hypothetical protein